MGQTINFKTPDQLQNAVQRAYIKLNERGFDVIEQPSNLPGIKLYSVHSAMFGAGPKVAEFAAIDIGDTRSITAQYIAIKRTGSEDEGRLSVDIIINAGLRFGGDVPAPPGPPKRGGR